MISAKFTKPVSWYASISQVVNDAASPPGQDSHVHFKITHMTTARSSGSSQKPSIKPWLWHAPPPQEALVMSPNLLPHPHSWKGTCHPEGMQGHVPEIFFFNLYLLN